MRAFEWQKRVQIVPGPADGWSMWNYVYRQRRFVRRVVAQTQPGTTEDLRKRPRVQAVAKTVTPA